MASLSRWVRQTGQELDNQGVAAVTFVIVEPGDLRIADRRSEHVACSGGHPVLSAGEMLLRVSESSVMVAEVPNHSTGFCPEPESWPDVAGTLDRSGTPPGDSRRK